MVGGGGEVENPMFSICAVSFLHGRTLGGRGQTPRLSLGLCRHFFEKIDFFLLFNTSQCDNYSKESHAIFSFFPCLLSFLLLSLSSPLSPIPPPTRAMQKHFHHIVMFILVHYWKYLGTFRSSLINVLQCLQDL